MELIKIGFLSFKLLDLIDILIVTYLFYKLYELLRGSMILRVFWAIVAVFLIWKLVGLLHLGLLKSILDQFLGVGTIAVIILFAPEIRRLLLVLGKNTFIDKLRIQLSTDQSDAPKFEEIADAIYELANTQTGAIIVFTGSTEMKLLQDTGDKIDASISKRLLLSIFNKTSPLHDGAVIIHKGKIGAARCVLPITDNPSIAPDLGLRHRASLGITEISDALVVIVSEEKSMVSLAYEGELERDIDRVLLLERLKNHYINYYGTESTTE